MTLPQKAAVTVFSRSLSKTKWQEIIMALNTLQETGVVTAAHRPLLKVSQRLKIRDLITGVEQLQKKGKLWGSKT
jgi:hypothetical protein